MALLPLAPEALQPTVTLMSQLPRPRPPLMCSPLTMVGLCNLQKQQHLSQKNRPAARALDSWQCNCPSQFA